MNRLLILGLLIISAFDCLKGQVRAIDFGIFVEQPYPRTAEEFLSIEDQISIDVYNNTDADQEIMVQYEIYKDGELWAKSNLDYREFRITVPAYGVETITSSNAQEFGLSFDESNMVFTNEGTYTELLFNRALPDGLYSICFTAFEPDVPIGEQPIQLSESYPISCGLPFEAFYSQPPQLLTNTNEECIDSDVDEPIIFDWFMSLSDLSINEVRYSFKLIQLIPGGSPEEQMLTSGAEVIHETELFYDPDNYSYQIIPSDLGLGPNTGLQPGFLYAWQVKVIEIDGVPQRLSDSQSPVGVFQYKNCDDDNFEGDDNVDEEDADNLGECLCEYETIPGFEDPDNVTYYNQTLSQFKAGKFLVHTSMPLEPINGKYSGEGTIKLDLLMGVELKIAFDDVTLIVDSEDKVRMAPGGNIYALTEEENPASGQIADLLDEGAAGTPDFPGKPNRVGDLILGQVPSDKIEEFDQVMESVMLLKDIVSQEERGLPLAIQQEFNGMELIFGITAVRLQAHRAEYHVVVNIPFMMGDEQKYISFGSWVCGGPTKFANDATLHMVNDLEISGGDDETENFTLTFTGTGTSTVDDLNPESSQTHTYITFDCQGLNSGQLIGNLRLPTNHFTMQEEQSGVSTGEPVSFNFQGSFERFEGEETEDEVESSSLHWFVEVDGEGSDPFQINSLDGWGFLLEDAVLDFSELKNFEGMEFPDEYVFEGTDISSIADSDKVRWTGFYMSRLKLLPPPYFLGENSQLRLGFGVDVTNMLIDPQFSGVISNPSGESILSINEGEIDGFGISIDNVNIEIVQNAFRSGEMNGNIGVPFFEEQDDGLVYSSLISRSDNENKYTFLVEPSSNGQKIPMWQLATLTMSESSHIRLSKVTEDNFKLHAALVGSLKLDLKAAEKIGLPGVGVNLVYDSEKGFNTNRSNFAFNMTDLWNQFNENFTLPEFDYSDEDSPQNDNSGNLGSGVASSIGDMGEFQGFDISLNKLELVFLPGDNTATEGFSFRPALKIDADINLGFGGQDSSDENAQFGAGAGITIKTIGTAAPEYTFSFDGIDLDRIRLKGNIPGTTVDGELKINRGGNTEGEVGEGFEAVLAAKFPSGFAAYVGGEFGKNSSYNYWYLEAMAKFPEPGIVMGPVSMASAGLGIYYNMDMNMGIPVNDDDALGEKAMELAAQENGIESDIDLDELSKESSQIDLNTLPNIANVLAGLRGGSSNKPFPKNDTGGFSLLTSLSMPGGSSGLHLDIGIAAQFGGNNNLSTFNIRGKAFAMTPVDSESKYTNPKFAVGVDLLWKVHDTGTEFTGNLDAFLNLKRGRIGIMGAANNQGKMGQARLYIDTRPESEKWFFYAGNPYSSRNNYAKQYMGIKIAIPPLGGSRYDGYFMLGDGIPDELPPLPLSIRRLFNSFDSGDDDNSIDGPNIVSSASRSISGQRGFAFGMKVTHDFVFPAWIARAKVNLVAGMDFNLTDTRDNNGKVPKCNGSPVGINGWYAQGQVFAGIDGSIQAKNPFKDDAWWDIIAVQAAVKLAGGGPNPSWFAGAVGLRVSAFGGLVSGETSFNVKLGEKCNVNQTPFGGMNFIQSLSPTGSNIDVYETATLKLNYPVDVDYTFVEYSASGREIPVTYIPKVRDFRVVQTTGPTPRKTFYSKRKIDNTKYEILLRDLPLGANFEVKAEIGASYIRGIDGALKTYKVSNQPWKQSEEVTFETIREIDDFQQYITSTTPFHTRNFHFVDNSKVIRINLDQNRLADLYAKYPYVDRTFTKGSKEYKQVKKLICKIYRNKNLEYIDRVYYDPSTLYSMHHGWLEEGLNTITVDIVYESSTTITEGANYDSEIKDKIALYNRSSMYDQVTKTRISNDFDLNLDLGTSISTSTSEERVLGFVFGTSRFRNIHDKIRSFETAKYGWHNVVKCHTYEPFDKIDLGESKFPNDPKIKHDVWRPGSDGAIYMSVDRSDHPNYRSFKDYVDMYSDFRLSRNTNLDFDIYRIPSGKFIFMPWFTSYSTKAGYKFTNNTSRIHLGARYSNSQVINIEDKGISTTKRSIFRNTGNLFRGFIGENLKLFHSMGQYIMDPIPVNDPLYNYAIRYYFQLSHPNGFTTRFKHPATELIENYRRLQSNYSEFVNSVKFNEVSTAYDNSRVFILEYKYRKPINMYSRTKYGNLHSNCGDYLFASRLYSVPFKITLDGDPKTIILQPISN